MNDYPYKDTIWRARLEDTAYLTLTKFLFTGDIEYDAQKRIYEEYMDESRNKKDHKLVDLVKMPHHGAYTGALQTFFSTFMPDYIVISVGRNGYEHPDQRTLDLFSNKKSDWKPKVYRTDENGDIFVTSNGKKVSIKTSR